MPDMKKKFPAPPRHLAQPPLDTPILEWWAREYDYVYVVLNPFFRVPGYRPETAAYGPIHSDALKVPDIVSHITSPRQLRPNEAPEHFADIIKAAGQPLSWSAVSQAIGADYGPDFQRNVRLWTLEVDREDRDDAIASKLSQYCRETGTYPPEEDQLPAILEPMLGRFLEALGIETVTLWSEWREASIEVAVSSFAREMPVCSIPNDRCCAVAAPGLLLSWEFDDVAGLLAMRDARLANANPADFFETMPVTPEMYADVFNPPDSNIRRVTEKQ